jgi:uncharacterized protein YnzC (UPF0291/DUF896 family)
VITDEMIARINELAAKSKTEEGLTKEEKNEQKKLREQYLQSIRENVRSQLERIEFVDDKPKH